MIELLILLGWLLPTLVTFRYTGYARNVKILEGEHEGAIICSFCRCTECGAGRTDHMFGQSKCGIYYKQDGYWTGMHPTSFLLGLLQAAVWPLILAHLGAKAAGITRPAVNYFKPPPEIQSREERRTKRLAEQKIRIEALEARNSELEKELGIGA